MKSLPRIYNQKKTLYCEKATFSKKKFDFMIIMEQDESIIR